MQMQSGESPGMIFTKMTDKNIERFESKYIRGDPNECWNWLGSRDKHGYGEFHLQTQTAKAHRISKSGYDLHSIKVQVVMHKCDNPSCINPEHLQLGTQIDNIRDMHSKGREPRGSRHWHTTLVEEDIPNIRELKELGLHYKDIGIMFNVRPAVIRNICTGKTWAHI